MFPPVLVPTCFRQPCLHLSPIVNSIHLNVFSTWIVLVWEKTFEYSASKDAYLSFVHNIHIVDITPHRDLRFLYLCVYWIKTFQSAGVVLVVDHVYSPFCNVWSHNFDFRQHRRTLSTSVFVRSQKRPCWKPLYALLVWFVPMKPEFVANPTNCFAKASPLFRP